MKNTSFLTSEAARLAFKFHKIHENPNSYIARHLGSVVDIVGSVEHLLIRDNIDADICIAVAWLHDSKEDTDIREADLAPLGHDVVSAVNALTMKGPRNRRNYANIRPEGGTAACVVKIADRLANIEASWRERDYLKLKMYAEEHERFINGVAYSVRLSLAEIGLVSRLQGAL